LTSIQTFRYNILCTNDSILDNVDDNFLLVTDWSIEEILQIDNLTNDIHVVPGDKNAEYMGIFVDQKKKRMIWAHYFDEEIVSANFNGSDRKVIADLGIFYIPYTVIFFSVSSIKYLNGRTDVFYW
jgi:hypothetical protein